MAIAWRVLATVIALGAVAVAGMAFGMPELAFLAAGALASYLGRVNGAAGNSGTSR